MSTIDIQDLNLSALQKQNLQHHSKGGLGVVFETEEGKLFVPLEALQLWEKWGKDEDPTLREVSMMREVLVLLADGRDEASDLLSAGLEVDVDVIMFANIVKVSLPDGHSTEFYEQELMASRIPMQLIRRKMGL